MFARRVRILVGCACAVAVCLVSIDHTVQWAQPERGTDRAPSHEFLRAVPDYEWAFPRDHFRHDGYRTEWWYFTGHLRSSEGVHFGYQFTFFRIGLQGGSWSRDRGMSSWSTNALILGHASIANLTSQQHVFSEVLYRESPLLGEFSAADDAPERESGSGKRPIGWSLAPAGTDGRWKLDWNGRGFEFSMTDARQQVAFTIEARTTKPLVYQGPNGYSRKGRSDEAASQYYSFTSLETSGEIDFQGTHYSVSGQSWMDKEFSSSQLTTNQVGWDWFSLQFSDGTEMMLYRLRRADGTTDFSRATMVSTRGEPRYLEDFDWMLVADDYWTSPHTEARYPSRWRLRVDQQSWIIRPLMPDQENRSRIPGGVFYWEGAVEIVSESQAKAGVGYVELTGYGEDNRPPV